MAPVERFDHAGFGWQARPGGRALVEAVCAWLDDPARAGAVTVKASQARVVWRWATGGETFYVKRYRVRGWSERLKYLAVAPRAVAEWRAAVDLEAAGIEAAPPVAVGVARRGPWLSDALFLAREVPGVPWNELHDELKAAGADRGPLLEATADLLRRLLAANLFHPDLHGGNMLGRLEDGRPRLALVDLHAVQRRGRLSARARAKVIGKLAHSLWLMVDEADLGRALDLLAPDPAEGAALRARVARVERTRLRSRSKRCVTESTEFTRDLADGWTVWRRRDAPLDALLGALAAGEGTLGDRPVEFLRAPGSLLPAWRAAHALRVRGVPAVQAFACLERRSLLGVREAALVREVLPGARPLAQVEAADAALEAAALEVVARLHAVGLRASPDRLLAVTDDGGWRVVVTGETALPPDAPLAPVAADADRAAVLAALRAPR